MNEQSLRFRIGVFVLSAMILLAVLIILFGRFPTIFKGKSQRYYIEFDYAPGVAVNTPVRRSGVRIGQVEKVELDDNTGKVVVTIVLDPPHVLFQGDQPTLIHGALSGDTTIDIVPPPEKEPAERVDKQVGEIQPVGFQAAQQAAGQAAPEANQPPPARTPAEPGTKFKGVTQTDVAGILNEMSKLTPPAREAFAEMRRTLESYDRLTPLMQETLREIRDLAKASREVVPELRRTNEEIQVTSRNWARLGERLDILLRTNEEKLVKTLDNFSDTMVRVGNVFNEENQRNFTVTLRNVSAGSKNLESLSRNTDELLRDLRQASKPLAERSGTILKNLDESTERLNQTLAETRDLLRAVNQSDGTLRRFLSDPDLYNNLTQAACMLTRALPRVDRILKDVEVFADKIARHPESLGIGGAVSPSSGLKESPTSTLYRQHLPGH
jgi:phospholipid/cholesterol/gamma-HCH transport system substrate-binding protein